MKNCGPATNPAWVEFVEKEVAVEEARKASIEARGLSALTSSGAVATVLLALVSLTKKGGRGTLVVPGSARPWVEAALTAFLMSAALALLTNVPVNLYWTKPRQLSDYIYGHWNDTAGATQQLVLDHRIERLKRLNRWNARKGWTLILALTGHVVAILLIVVAVFAAF